MVKDLLFSLINEEGMAKRLKLLKQLEKLEGEPVPARRQLRLPQGAIRAAVLAVMTKARKPLLVKEIHKRVEINLKRDVSYDTVCSFLTKSAKNHRASGVHRVGKGQYHIT